MTALAGLHKIDIAKVPYLGEPVPFAEDVTDGIGSMRRQRNLSDWILPKVRQRLLDTMPADAPVGIFHGDFQTANLFASKEMLNCWR